MSMTRDEALKTIAALLQHTETDCDYAYDNADGSVDLLPGQDIADALRLALAALREQAEHRWIPVTERMPERMKDVLVIRTHGEPDIEFLFYDGTWVGDTEGRQNEVTHWRPMPEPAKEGS